MRHTAPYNFVPLSDHVTRPVWGPLVQHDAPLAGAVCGKIVVEIEAQGPLFVRGQGDRHVRGPDGRPVIPGTSLRGMLRNVVEIATFSALNRVNAHRFGVRDLHDRPHYADHMSDFGTGPDGKAFLQPLVSAGWLVRRPGDDNNPAEIRPCHFTKVHYSELIRFAATRGIHDFRPGEPQGAEKKYATWADRSVHARTRWLATTNPPGRPPRIGNYGVTTELTGAGQGTPGTLVFTGQPSRWSPPPPGTPPPTNNNRPKPKQNDFVFFDMPNAPPLPVSAQVFEQFEFVHSDAGAQHRTTREPNAIWGHFKPTFDAGGQVPVFYLLNADHQVHAMGFAMMFRLASTYSTADLVRHAQPLDGAEDRQRPDLARLIFGDVPLERGARADGKHPGLRGRVSLGLARLQGDYTELPVVEAVFGAPKASFHPAYVEQDPQAGPGAPVRRAPDGKPIWRMAMDRDARARGWKRYRIHQGPVLAPVLPTNAQGHPLTPEQRRKQVTTFRPIKLAQDARFVFPIRVHNLLPIELGALLWALDFGGANGALHGLGMAKNLGYGAVRLKVVSADLRVVTGGSLEVDPVSEFKLYMESDLKSRGGWATSRQIHELVACACPAPDEEIAALRLILSPTLRVNEFADAKREGAHLPLAGKSTWKGTD